MSFNPFDIQKQMFAEFEKNMGEYLQKTMREPAVMKIIAQNMSASLHIKGLVKEQLEKVLQSLDIPTQTTMAGLYKTVHNLETRLLDMEEQIEDLTDELARAKKAAKSAPKADTKKTVKPDTKPVAKKAAKSASKPVAKKAAKSASKPVAKKAAKSASKPVTKKAAKSASKPVTKKAATPAPKAVAKKAAKPAPKTAAKKPVKAAPKKSPKK